MYSLMLSYISRPASASGHPRLALIQPDPSGDQNRPAAAASHYQKVAMPAHIIRIACSDSSYITNKRKKTCH